MAANHRTAVAMSRAEVDRGLNLALRELARRMVRDQGEQLDASRGWLPSSRRASAVAGVVACSAVEELSHDVHVVGP
ncbi:MAG TPA: DUF305 domain-containing protein [Nocardioidaceae bacterium]|nr:DUF305 domain-containing protein [Nocardioidaceae bacterium]